MTHSTAAGSSELVLAMTGASGAPYALRLLRVLCRRGHSVHLSISPSAAQVLREELGLKVNIDSFEHSSFGNLGTGRLIYHHYQDFSAGIASGSFPTGGMIVIPCSMSTLGAIAGGTTTNLITRAADVHLKERRKLILVPRETPLSLIHLENMVRVTRAGAIILPACPAGIIGRAGWMISSTLSSPHLRSARHLQQPGAALGTEIGIDPLEDTARDTSDIEETEPDPTGGV